MTTFSPDDAEAARLQAIMDRIDGKIAAARHPTRSSGPSTPRLPVDATPSSDRQGSGCLAVIVVVIVAVLMGVSFGGGSTADPAECARLQDLRDGNQQR